MNKASAYIISKPLQYINAKNIPDNNKCRDCFITDTFYQASEFTNFISEKSTYWNHVKLFKFKYSILFYIILKRSNYSRLYIDFDYGLYLTFFLFFLRKLDIFAYEEGLGSYRIFSSKENKRGVASFYLKKWLKCENWIGGNRFSKGVYLYYPGALAEKVENTMQKEFRKLSTSVCAQINNSDEYDFFFDGIDFEKCRGKDVFIYITSWIINDKYKQYYDLYQDYYTILKPHPHIRENIGSMPDFDDIVYNIPAEILITRISNIAKKVIIIHENSSTLIYLQEEGLVNIEEINIALDKSKYMEIWKDIESQRSHN